MAPNEPRPTKAQRRDAARAKAKAIREAEARRAKRNAITRRSLIGLGATAVVAGGGWLIYDSVRTTKDDDKLPAAGEGIVKEKANRRGVPKPVLVDGAWTYGKNHAFDAITADAPVLDIYFDYSCHFCANFEILHAKEIGELLDAGKITLALHPTNILRQNWTVEAMNAMGLVLDNAPKSALAFHTAIFKLFSEAVSTRSASRLTVENLVTTAVTAGVPQATADKFNVTHRNNTYGPWTELATQAFQERKLEGTPTVFLDGKRLDLQTLNEPTALTELISGAGVPRPSATPSDAPAAPSADPSEGAEGEQASPAPTE